MVGFKYSKHLLLGFAGFLWVFVSACFAADTVIFRGEVDSPSKGSCRGMVVLWPTEGGIANQLERTNLVPDWVDEIDSECRFEIRVSPGSYYLQVIVRRAEGLSMGPPQVGDLLFSSEEYPQVMGNAGDQINLGTLKQSSEFSGYPEHVETGIVGRLVDEKGKPVAGHRVLAYLEKDMLSGLYAVSPESDADGTFRLHLVDDVEIYLQAREKLGMGQPPVGALAGHYGGKAPEPIKVQVGQRLEQVEIVVAPRIKEQAEDKK